MLSRHGIVEKITFYYPKLYDLDTKHIQKTNLDVVTYGATCTLLWQTCLIPALAKANDAHYYCSGVHTTAKQQDSKHFNHATNLVRGQLTTHSALTYEHFCQNLQIVEMLTDVHLEFNHEKMQSKEHYKKIVTSYKDTTVSSGLW